ncbi:MAG TPA: hypothetical protein VJ921_09350 [Vicinamibacteria bacterium]|nr:hypothetical protein [Vicinamibacteria bacterium]
MVGLQGESVFEYSERYGGLPLLHREHTSQEQGVEKLGVFLENTVEAFARVGEIPGAITRERGEEIMNEVDLVLGIDIRALGGRGTGVSQRLELRLRFRVDDPRNALGIPFLDEFSHASRTLRLALDEVPRLARVLAQIEDLRPRCTFTPSTPP